jgi:hypothetical protein
MDAGGGSGLWQATKEPPPSSSSSGISARQTGKARGQRGWKGHPGGGVIGLGTSPAGLDPGARLPRPGTGTAAISVRV